MLVEGKGVVAPAPVRILLSAGEVSDLAEVARVRDAYRNYGARSDAWGRGFVGNPILVGLVGEYAVCRFLNDKTSAQVAIDRALRARGDGGKDVEIAGLRIQIKTRATGNSNLIRRVTDGAKKILALDSSVFVFARWVPDAMTVELLGWVWDADARQHGRHEKSRYGHWNLRVEDDRLMPMSRLAEEVEARSLS